jgi:MFS family permease
VAITTAQASAHATAPGAPASTTAQQSIETSASWTAATVGLFVLTFYHVAPLLAPVALKPIAAELGTSRSVPALANSLAWLGSGAGAIAFGWIADRVGIVATLAFGAVMVGAGLAWAATGGATELLIGYGLLVGVLGGGAINVPLIIYISRWFDRHRGSAVALVSSGQYIAGAIWPPCIAFAIERVGWRATMVMFGIAAMLGILVAALVWLRPTPIGGSSVEGGAKGDIAIAVGSRGTYILLCVAGFLCCTPMAMPPGHLVALCSDLGIPPARGALMLSVLLGSALFSRLFWGWLTDRAGGLYTILAASMCQTAAMVGFVFTQNEAGLFAVSAAFGLGFSGLIPAYVVVLRAIFPAEEAAWRMPIWFFSNIIGMALGGWLAGYVYDQLGSYGPAFVLGAALNIANIGMIAVIARRHRYA